ncbi:transketolase, N-terminal subunit [Synergistales bacterium]|nr:transketolase, N-terminal subunit [Synergistales bacterium]
MKDFPALKHKFFAARRRLLKMYYESNSGHLGGSLSCLEALIVLFHAVMTPRDRFILSKGHAAGALYVALWSVGLISDEKLSAFSLDNTTLPGHPSGSGIPGMLFPTGSLGHGISLASGLALAAKYKSSDYNVFCLCSDGEWQEGSCWEALIFAIHNRLDNLTVLIDQNGLQAFGTIDEVASMSDLELKIAAFGPSVVSVDGHNLEAINAALTPAGQESRNDNTKIARKPRFILLRTRKGKGTHFENDVSSHYLPLTKEQYIAACEVLIEQEEAL